MLIIEWAKFILKALTRGGWTAPRKASWEIRARFLIHARTVVK